MMVTHGITEIALITIVINDESLNKLTNCLDLSILDRISGKTAQLIKCVLQDWGS